MSKAAPKLRFPEFRETPIAKLLPLSSVVNFVSDRVPVSELDSHTYVSTETLLPDFGGIGAPGTLPTSGSFTLYATDDVLISNIRPYLKKVWQADRDGAASNDVIVVRSTTACLPTYIAALLRSERFIGYVMQGAKGVKMPRGDTALMKAFPVPVPTDAEQWKIAECLTSLDDLISAETRRLEAFRAWKKSLLQNLFPHEGETTPSLRFPDFDGDWRVVPAGKLFSNRNERGAPGLPIYSVTLNDGMVKRSSLDRKVDDISAPDGNKKVYQGDLAYNMMRMWQGASGVAPEDCLVSPAYVVLAPTPGVCSEFYAYYFKLPESLNRLTSYSRGLTKDRLRLYFDDFARMPVALTSEAEQHRIASCLGSLDNLIAKQAMKLDTLKVQMQGLMQGLFPFAGGGQHV